MNDPSETLEHIKPFLDSFTFSTLLESFPIHENTPQKNVNTKEAISQVGLCCISLFVRLFLKGFQILFLC